MTEIRVKNLRDAELASIYKDSTDGKFYRRTTAKGEFTPSGLKVGGKITEVTLNSTSWTALPITALTNRNAICIQNKSGSEIKINYDNSVSGYIGIIIVNGGERFYDVTDTITIYAKAASGNPTINIEEIA